MRTNVKYIYICSAGHSGSTLLDLLLGSHSMIGSLGEIIQLSKNISLNSKCTCGKGVRECPVWKKVVRGIDVKLGIDTFRNPYSLHLGFPSPYVVKDKIHTSLQYKLKKKVLRGLRYIELKYRLPLINFFLGAVYEGIENTFLVYDTYRKTTNCDIIVDSSKSYLEALGLYIKKPDNVRIILLFRDGRGVFYSNAKRGYNKKKSIKSWKKHYKRTIPLLKRYVSLNHQLWLRYEDLSKDPSTELIRICKFLNIEYEKDMLDYSRHVHHITNGNNMRFNSSSVIKTDNAWKEMLSIKNRELFDEYAGEFNRRLGYL